MRRTLVVVALLVTSFAAIPSLSAAPVVSVSLSSASVTEGNAGETNVSINVTLSVAAPASLRLNVTPSGGTARAGGDYLNRATAVTFNKGVSSKLATFVVIGDQLDEITETFNVD